MRQPKVSVLLPVYNAERYVREAIESILTQEFGDFEVLVTDDGSTDGSLEILEAVARSDDRVKLTSQPNAGLVDTLNEMLHIARAPYLARMDADDVAYPNRFGLQVAALDSNPDLVAVGSSVNIVDPEGLPLARARRPCSHDDIDRWHMAVGNGAAMCHPSVMMRRDPVLQIGGYRKEYWPAEDADIFLRLAEIGRLANLDDFLLAYRFHLGSIGHQNPWRQRDALYRSAADAARRRGVSPPVRSIPEPDDYVVETVTNNHRKWVWWALSSGYPETARKHAVAAFRREPLNVETWRALYCALRGH